MVGWVLLVAASADELSEAKKSFEKQDAALNKTYAELKKGLAPYLFEKLQEEQREWIEHRDYLSDYFDERRETPEQKAEKWEIAAGLTESRVEWLNAWNRIGKREGWSGKYSDSRGGWLEIVEKDGKVHFALSVVRGPTFHLGDIRGELRVNGGMAWFEVKEEGQDAPTWLTFVETNDGTGRIRVFGANTQYFHGARAYFEGSYLWLGELTDEEKREVIEGEEK
ncbi:urease-associated protein [Haloferula helveola]|uniref:Urease-associated protein n=2 Tax=Haloferula helveola TaxID=490095 RepID=A0ABN6H3B5_9BACT|nr:urease-associated protein [Haloferula helveola]